MPAEKTSPNLFENKTSAQGDGSMITTINNYFPLYIEAASAKDTAKQQLATTISLDYEVKLVSPNSTLPNNLNYDRFIKKIKATFPNHEKIHVKHAPFTHTNCILSEEMANKSKIARFQFNKKLDKNQAGESLKKALQIIDISTIELIKKNNNFPTQSVQIELNRQNTICINFKEKLNAEKIHQLLSAYIISMKPIAELDISEFSINYAFNASEIEIISNGELNQIQTQVNNLQKGHNNLKIKTKPLEEIANKKPVISLPKKDDKGSAEKTTPNAAPAEILGSAEKTTPNAAPAEILNAVLTGINNYLARPRDFFSSHIGFFSYLAMDQDRGRKRALLYKNTLNDSALSIDEKLIVIAAILHSDGAQLQIDAMKGVLGFNSLSDDSPSNLEKFILSKRKDETHVKQAIEKIAAFANNPSNDPSVKTIPMDLIRSQNVAPRKGSINH